MKKKSIALALSTLMVTGLVGCGSNEGGSNEEATLKVGMVTDSGTIDDKSFNQGSWEGIGLAENELGIERNYMQPAGETEVDYLTEIQNLYDADFKFIVCPGFKFETAIYSAQETYSDAKFVIIDGEPNDGNGNALVADNTVSIFFAEQESGFAAGVAAALELQHRLSQRLRPHRRKMDSSFHDLDCCCQSVDFLLLGVEVSTLKFDFVL